MPMRTLLACMCCLIAPTLGALEYPGPRPLEAKARVSEERGVLANESICCEWDVARGRIASLTVTNLHTGQQVSMNKGHMPCLSLSGKRTLDLAKLTLKEHLRIETLASDENSARGEAKYGGKRLTAAFSKRGIHIRWSVELRDDANYVTQTLALTAEKPTPVKSLTFMETPLDGAEQIGEVDGSVVVCGDLFFAVEHPLAENAVSKTSHARCSLHRDTTLQPDHPWEFSSVMGATPPGQLRRAFLYYLERRRARPYQPFLHYNSWYHLNIDRPDNRMTEAQCIETIEHFGLELIKKRGVKLDAFVWDDGWDDFDSLWEFHGDFPRGFRTLKAHSEAHDVAQGVWMSPWGGYGAPKQRRLAYGKAQGYETNRGGFSMAGPKYRAAFLDSCLAMMRDHGVVFFKFDGMGAGNSKGASGKPAEDIDAVLDLTQTLRDENPQLFISATVGTWATPFWLRYADSIWRQGGDTGFYGSGNTRQQWITYRDMFCYQRVVQLGPLYPLNALMLHGPCIGDRANPGKMSRDEQSVSDEIWTFFGSGTNLQELYISPDLLTPSMWDELAHAAKWSRAHTDVLVDSHWIGGDPGQGVVYGWAAWQPRKGIVTLRNPSAEAQTFALELRGALGLPGQDTGHFRLVSPRSQQRIAELQAAADKALRLEMQPFEVLVFEAIPLPVESDSE